MIVTNDVAYSRVLRSMSNQGRDDDGTWMNHVRLGYNYRLDEMSAAPRLSQLRRLDTISLVVPGSPPGTANGSVTSRECRSPTWRPRPRG